MSQRGHFYLTLTHYLVGVDSIILNQDIFDKLCAALRTKKTLEKLTLKNIQLEDHHISMLVNALEKNTTLKRLDLRGNKITNKGAKALASLLKRNKAISVLKLSNNNIGSEGADAIITALDESTTLTTVEVAQNNSQGAKITEEQYAKITMIQNSKLFWSDIHTILLGCIIMFAVAALMTKTLVFAILAVCLGAVECFSKARSFYKQWCKNQIPLEEPSVLTPLPTQLSISIRFHSIAEPQPLPPLAPTVHHPVTPVA